jgi:hypothetical protein
MIDIIKMNNGINVKVDKGNTKGVSKYDLEEHLEDLFKFKKSYKMNEKIRLSTICDAMFDLIFCGSNKNTKEILFRIC